MSRRADADGPLRERVPGDPVGAGVPARSGEAALRLLQAIFDHTTLLVAYLDRDLRFVMVNRAYAEADGRHPADFVGLRHFDLYPNPENEAIFRRVIETGEPHFALAKPFEYAHAPERGVTYWDWSLVPMRGDDGQVVGAVLSLLNVTDRIRALEAHQTSERRYRILFEQASDGIALVREPGVIAEVNPRMCEMLGYSHEELVGMDCRALLPPEDLAREPIDWSALSRGERVVQERRIRRKDGRLVDVEVSARALGGGQFLAIARDITERRAAQEALRLKEHAIESAINGIAFAGLDRRLTYVNPAFLRMWGYGDRGEVLGRLAVEFFADEEEAEGLLRQVGDGRSWVGEVTARRPDGSCFDVQMVASLITDEVGRPIHLLSSFCDVTEQRRAAERLRASLQEKEVLLREVHHRVKNNLQVISSLLHLQARRLGGGPAREMFVQAENRVRTMALIHERLYQSDDLARVDLREYVRSLVGELGALYGLDPGALRLDLDIAPIRLDLDIAPIRLDLDRAVPCALIINELVSNALKHAFPNGRPGRIRISLDRAGDLLELVVEDDGVGLPASPQQAGAHLGLALVRSLARQVGGAVEIRVEGGTRVRVTLGAGWGTEGGPPERCGGDGGEPPGGQGT